MTSGSCLPVLRQQEHETAAANNSQQSRDVGISATPVSDTHALFSLRGTVFRTFRDKTQPKPGAHILWAS
jgi:hypothetical protein